MLAPGRSYFDRKQLSYFDLDLHKRFRSGVQGGFLEGETSAARSIRQLASYGLHLRASKNASHGISKIVTFSKLMSFYRR